MRLTPYSFESNSEVAGSTNESCVCNPFSFFKIISFGFSVKLTNLESLTLMQETRLIQLDTAIQMELWQEAYKSAEDLHNMMLLTKDKDKRIVKPSSYVNYYDKVSAYVIFVFLQLCYK